MTAERASLLRAALARTDSPALGTFVKLPSQETVELLAIAGFDFIVIDLEHAPLDLETTFRHIGVALHLGVSSVVRVPGLAGGWIQRILDAGAEGIMLPHTDTAAQAEEAVRAIRFEPWGTRGAGSTSRAGGWGSVPVEEYVRFGQEEVVFMPQIESGDGARNAAEIAAVRGVDALFIGIADLSVNIGKAQGAPEVAQLIHGVAAVAAENGLPLGGPSGTSTDAVQSMADRGFTFMVQSNDASMFGAAATAAVAAGRRVRLS